MDAFNERVAILYPITRYHTGYSVYARRLMKGLDLLGARYKPYSIKKREIVVGGKPFGGSVSQIIGSSLVRPKERVVHSLTPQVITSRTNVLTLHDITPLVLSQTFSNNIIQKRSYESLFKKVKEIRNIIVFTEIMRDKVIDVLNVEAENIHIVPQGIDHSLFYPQAVPSLKKPGKKFLVVTVGDFNPRKRFDILFEALGGNPDFDILHIGPVNSWDENSKKMYQCASKFSNVRFLGEADSATLRSYYSTADLLVHLSEDEGFGLTTIEAMACGTNVLVNRLPIFQETLGEMPFYADLNRESVARGVEAAVRRLRSKEELIEYSRKYSLDKMAEGTIQVYKKV